MKEINTIHFCIVDNILFNVMNEESILVLWKKLEKLYMGNSLTNKLYLKQQFYGLKMTEGANMFEHLNVFTKLKSR